ncbi:MAG: hypothetical protein QOH21_1470, partial [Acidobacteriota bacterium]|nr:hypothetical protein [Acidobacteriota bacterium]
MATAAEMSTHPAIDRALQLAARNDPAASSRAAASAERLLEGRIAAGPAGFTGSTLSMDGFPLEIAFSSGDPALRYTVDFGAPG